VRSTLPGKPETMAPFVKRLVEPLLIGLREMANSPVESAAPTPQWSEWLLAWNGGTLDHTR
jgi:hypothetical protein